MIFIGASGENLPLARNYLLYLLCTFLHTGQVSISAMITNIHLEIKYMLFAGLGSVRIVKNCDRGLENAARGRRPRAAFSSPRSQFFTIRTDPKPANNLFIFFLR